MTSSSYKAVQERWKPINDLNHTRELLDWDSSVMMPAGGGEARAEALGTLAGLIHELMAAPEMADSIESAAASDLNRWEAANIHLIQRKCRKARAVPPILAMEHSKAASICEQAWRRARGENDWNAVGDEFETVIDRAREKASVLGEALDCSPYDAMLDDYEPGLRRTDLDPIFDDLAKRLPTLIDHAIEHQRPPLPLQGPFPINRQETLGRSLMSAFGFDFTRGRLDVSHHPFCAGHGSDDIRITTRYDESDFLKAMLAVIHETGHALYQQGLPAAWRGQPVGDALGMALHESQSLMMEMQIARGPAFLEFAAPIIQRALLGSETKAAEWQAENLIRLATRVKRGLIRVEADELTYPLHILLRYRLETALLDGSLAAADLPDAWDEGMSAELGRSANGDLATGCMQDVHWFAGLLGYFPTYTLGAIIAAQLCRGAKEQVAGLEDAIRKGELGLLVGWLREKVHGLGQLLPSMELVAEITGVALGTDAFLEHLKARYGSPSGR